MVVIVLARPTPAGGPRVLENLREVVEAQRVRCTLLAEQRERLVAQQERLTAELRRLRAEDP